MRYLVITVLVCILTILSEAQDHQLEEVIVTGSRVGFSSYSVPSANISKKADFMTKSIELVNDSRSHERRPAELIKTIENMMAAARRNKSIELSYGGNFLNPVAINDDVLRTISNDDDNEVSSIDIIVKVAVDKSRSTKEQIKELNEFINNIKRDGRTEIESYENVGLSIINPHQYRDEVLIAIANENARIANLVGNECLIRISGLQNRLNWVRGSIDELILYINYATEMECQPNRAGSDS